MPYPTRSVIVGELRAAMARRGVGTLQLAEAIGISATTMTTRMTGKVAFSVDELIDACEFLGVDLPSLFTAPAIQPGEPVTVR